MGAIRSPSASASTLVSPGSPIGEDVADQVLRLVDPAQDRVLAGEDLHRHDRVEALALEDARRRGRSRRRPSRRTGSRATAGCGRGPSALLAHDASPWSAGDSGGPGTGRRGSRSVSSAGRRLWSASVAYGSAASGPTTGSTAAVSAFATARPSGGHREDGPWTGCAAAVRGPPPAAGRSRQDHEQRRRATTRRSATASGTASRPTSTAPAIRAVTAAARAAASARRR